MSGRRDVVARCCLRMLVLPCRWGSFTDVPGNDLEMVRTVGVGRESDSVWSGLVCAPGPDSLSPRLILCCSSPQAFKAGQHPVLALKGVRVGDFNVRV